MPVTVENTVEDAQRVIFLAVQYGIEYALGHGIAIEVIQAAALKTADFLRVFGTPPKSHTPETLPKLRVIRPPSRQLRFLWSTGHDHHHHLVRQAGNNVPRGQAAGDRSH